MNRIYWISKILFFGGRKILFIPRILSKMPRYKKTIICGYREMASLGEPAVCTTEMRLQKPPVSE